jgi:4-hydroxybenzoate polyprenyltransferase
MIAFFKLIRYQNLLMLALMQLVLRYAFLYDQNLTLALSNFEYLILVLSTVLIAGAGYIINDIFDQETDAFNKPEKQIVGKFFTENTAYNLYAVLNVSGVALGFYLSNVIEKPSFAAIFIVIAATLYVYASGLKQTLLVGNVLVAVLSAFSVIIIGLFDLYPSIAPENQQTTAVFFKILMDYAFFAFGIHLLREIVKDMEDVYGDNLSNMNTLAVEIGIAKTAKIVFVLGIAFISVIFWYVYTYYFLSKLYIATAYSIVFIISPLIYFVINIFSVNETVKIKSLSKLLKIVMLFGILSVIVVALNVKNNA